MSVPDELSSKKQAWSREDLKGNPHGIDDKPSRVNSMFTSIARAYDFNNHLHSLWLDQMWRRRAVKIANLTRDDDVLDVACGTGDLAMAFQRGGAKSVLGIDFTLAMLDIAVTKANKTQLPIEYRQGDAMNLQLEDQSFDVVSIAFGIRNVQDPSKAIAEFHRVLKPAGRLIVLEFSTPPNPVIRTFNNLYTKRIMPITASLIARDRSGAYDYLPKSVDTFAEPKELAELIAKEGFKDVEQHPQSFGVCTITSAVKR